MTRSLAAAGVGAVAGAVHKHRAGLNRQGWAIDKARAKVGAEQSRKAIAEPAKSNQSVEAVKHLT